MGYSVSVNTGASSRTGTISVAGRTHKVEQEGTAKPDETPFPADQSPYCGCGSSECQDERIEMCEAIGYAAAWKRGDHDDMAAAIRGLCLWKQGECYQWGETESNWMPDSCE